MKYWPSLILIWAVALSPTRGETVIEGVVKYPPPAKISAAASARYQLKAGAVATPEPPGAIVYLEGSFPNRTPKPPAKETVRQEGFQFVPGLLAIEKGTRVEFPNRDDDYHHVFSYSKAKEFDLGRYRNNEKPAAIDFDKPGVVKIGCEIHDHMRAFIVVLDTPYFTKTDGAGKFRLTVPDVPAGRYLLKAWVNEKTVWEQPVELKEGVSLKIDFPST